MTEKRVNVFMLGADPEFCLIDKTTNFALWDLRGVYNVSADPQIGRDCGNLVELRPKPAQTAYELVARLKTLIESPVLEGTHQYLWKSGAVAKTKEPVVSYSDGTSSPLRERTLTLGGHIHFEAKHFPLEEKVIRTYADSYDGRTRTERTITYLAAGALNALTTLLLHLDILPAAESITRLKSSTVYGSETDSIRISARSFEYRRMCSWLFHPRVSFICLTCAKLAVADYTTAYEILNKATSFDALRKLVEVFAPKDDDAARLHERIFPRGLEAIKADPSVDFKAPWKRWKPEGVVLT